MNKIEQAADFLADKRHNPIRYDEIPAEFRPQTLNDAYQVQAALVERLLARLGGNQIGYKIACTNESAQALLQVDGPFYGSLLSATTYNLAYGLSHALKATITQHERSRRSFRSKSGKMCPIGQIPISRMS